MSFPPRFLDEIRARLTLSDVIGQRVSVKRAGREYKACCPFHKEKTPSFTINNDKQFYHCFGCGAHGDVIGFVMRHDNLSFPETVELLAGQAGLDVPKPDPNARAKAEKEKSLYSLMDEASTFFERNLVDVPLRYLEDRGLLPETRNAFRLGFAPADGQAMRMHLKDHGYTDAQMIDAGLLKKSTRGGSPHSFFRDRIMFPVSDRRGRIVAFGGRILPDHLRAPDRGDFVPPKYINSSDTVLFDKGKILYAAALAQQAVRDGASLIVTEGYMDVIAAHQGGFAGAIAPMGTALTEDQIVLLWRMMDDPARAPILCFDGDNAGRRAAARACERILPLLGPGQTAQFAFLPDGDDPDTLIRTKGAKAFQAVLDSALSLFDFMWLTHTAGRRFDTPESKAALGEVLHNQISLIAHKDVQAHYRQSLRHKISETFFPRHAHDRAQRGRNVPKPPSSVKLRRPVARKQAIKSYVMLAAVLNHPHIYSGVEEYIGHIHVSNQSIDRMRQSMIAVLEENPDLDRTALQDHLSGVGFSQEMRDILNESVYVHASFCSPTFDSGLVERDFLNWIRDVEARDWGEINAQWKQAFKDTDKDRENKIKAMMSIKASERA